MESNPSLCGHPFGSLPFHCTRQVHGEDTSHRITSRSGGYVEWVSDFKPAPDDIADPGRGETFIDMYTRLLA